MALRTQAGAPIGAPKLQADACFGAREAISWKRGDLFEAELWMLHDGPNAVKGDRVEAYLRFGDDESFVLGWYFDALEEGENRVGPVLRFRVPEIEEQTFKLILRVEGRADWNSEYDFCYRQD